MGWRPLFWLGSKAFLSGPRGYGGTDREWIEGGAERFARGAERNDGDAGHHNRDADSECAERGDAASRADHEARPADRRPDADAGNAGAGANESDADAGNAGAGANESDADAGNAGAGADESDAGAGGGAYAPAKPVLRSGIGIDVLAIPTFVPPAKPVLRSGIGIDVLRIPTFVPPGVAAPRPGGRIGTRAAGVLVSGSPLGVVRPPAALPLTDGVVVVGGAVAVGRSRVSVAVGVVSVAVGVVRARRRHVSGRRHVSSVGGGEGGQPAPVLSMSVSGSGVGSSVSRGSGFFFFGVAGLLAWFALGVPRLSCRLRLIKELGTPAPFVLLLDRPG